jgi:hypothetical protein
VRVLTFLLFLFHDVIPTGVAGFFFRVVCGAPATERRGPWQPFHLYKVKCTANRPQIAAICLSAILLKPHVSKSPIHRIQSFERYPD